MLHSEFAIIDLGSLNYFLGISTQRTASGMFLLQSKFARKILERARMHNCNMCRNPVDTKFKLGPDGNPITDPTLYRSLIHVSSTAQLTAYTNSDWDGFPVTRCSTSGGYHGVANVVAETAWIRNSLRELHNQLFTTTLVYCGNVLVLHVPSRFQYVDIFTKGLPVALFLEFHSSLNVRDIPFQLQGSISIIC
nr:hypothetical protein [Tanacetum cinerariifolium]